MHWRMDKFYYPIQIEKYIPQVFSFDNNYIHVYNITSLISNQLYNSNSTCYKCDYYNWRIIDEDLKNHYITIVRVECPQIIMIVFVFLYLKIYRMKRINWIL